jgi:ABC-type phosphate transport system substrate-binding protein
MKRLLLACVLLSLAESGFAQDAVYKVIVNAQNPVAAMRREQVATLFLNRKAAWSHGPIGAAVDQSMTSKVREAFSTEVLGQPLLGVQNYWRKRLMTEREAPPMVRGSDEEVIAFVAKDPGGIGYVAATTPLPPSVKVVRIADPVH